MYRHPIPQRVALITGAKKRGGNSWFLFDDLDEQWQYKYNQSVLMHDHWFGHVRVSIGCVTWRQIPNIIRFRLELGIDTD